MENRAYPRKAWIILLIIMVLHLDVEVLFCKIAQKMITLGHAVKAHGGRMLYKQFVSYIELLKVKTLCNLERKESL